MALLTISKKPVHCLDREERGGDCGCLGASSDSIGIVTILFTLMLCIVGSDLNIQEFD